jgi:hypothetical protein
LEREVSVKIKRPIFARSGVDCENKDVARVRKKNSLAVILGEWGLLFGAEVLLEIVKEVVESFDVCRVGGLLALHGRDDNFVAKSEFCEVGFFVCFFGLEALGKEVIQDGFLDSLGVRLLVHDPTSQLVGVFGGVFGELDDLHGSFFDGLEVGVHFFDDIVVSVDPARNLTVGRDGGRSEEGDGAKSED